MKTELLKYKPVSEKESPLNWNTVDQISKTIIKMELDHVQTYCFPNIVQILFYYHLNIFFWFS